MKEWFFRHKVSLRSGIVLFLLLFSVFLFLGKSENEFAQKVRKVISISLSRNQIVELLGEKGQNAFPDAISTNIVERGSQEENFSSRFLENAPEINSKNGTPDPFRDFSQNIDSILSPPSAESQYFVKNSNPKNIIGFYFLKKIEEIPTLFRILPKRDEVVKMDIAIPKNSSKHKMISERLFGYISNVDKEESGKTLTLIDLKTKKEKNISVSDDGMRIVSFFGSPNGEKIVIEEKRLPLTEEEMLTSNIPQHRVWVYDIKNPKNHWNIFEQIGDTVERWAIFWAKEDNKIYFNSCNTQDLQCNFGITRTDFDREEHIPLPKLGTGKYASSPILSPNGRHIAFIAGNGNTETPFYQEGDDENNNFLNKNTIWIFDLRNEKKKILMNFGTNRIIDHLAWAPDGMSLVFELRQIVMFNGQKIPRSKSAGIWQINLESGKFARIAPDPTQNPGQILSHLTPTPDGSGISFSIITVFPVLDTEESSNEVAFFLRFSDMRLFELGNISGILKNNSL